MKKIISSLTDWISFGNDVGYIFALRYKLGIAQEGKDFFCTGDLDNEITLDSHSNS